MTTCWSPPARTAVTAWSAPARRSSTTTCYSPRAVGERHPGERHHRHLLVPYWRASSTRAVVGWAPNRRTGRFPQMRLVHPAGDHVHGRRHLEQPMSQPRRRQPVLGRQAHRCASTDPPPKVIDGVSITRDCWQYQSTMSCGGTYTADQCTPLIAAGCTPCRRPVPAPTGNGRLRGVPGPVQLHRAGTDGHQATNCPCQRLLPGNQLLQHGLHQRRRLRAAMSMLEAGARPGCLPRQRPHAGVQGAKANSCRDRLLTNCCNSDASGRGMTNRASSAPAPASSTTS